VKVEKYHGKGREILNIARVEEYHGKEEEYFIS
jgi:hypothetical protein